MEENELLELLETEPTRPFPRHSSEMRGIFDELHRQADALPHENEPFALYGSTEGTAEWFHLKVDALEFYTDEEIESNNMIEIFQQMLENRTAEIIPEPSEIEAPATDIEDKVKDYSGYTREDFTEKQWMQLEKAEQVFELHPEYAPMREYLYEPSLNLRQMTEIRMAMEHGINLKGELEKANLSGIDDYNGAQLRQIRIALQEGKDISEYAPDVPGTKMRVMREAQSLEQSVEEAARESKSFVIPDKPVRNVDTPYFLATDNAVIDVAKIYEQYIFDSKKLEDELNTIGAYTHDDPTVINGKAYKTEQFVEHAIKQAERKSSMEKDALQKHPKQHTEEELRKAASEKYRGLKVEISDLKAEIKTLKSEMHHEMMDAKLDYQAGIKGLTDPVDLDKEIKEIKEYYEPQINQREKELDALNTEMDKTKDVLFAHEKEALNSIIQDAREFFNKSKDTIKDYALVAKESIKERFEVLRDFTKDVKEQFKESFDLGDKFEVFRQKMNAKEMDNLARDCNILENKTIPALEQLQRNTYAELEVVESSLTHVTQNIRTEFPNLPLSHSEQDIARRNELMSEIAKAERNHRDLTPEQMALKQYEALESRRDDLIQALGGMDAVQAKNETIAIYQDKQKDILAMERVVERDEIICRSYGYNLNDREAIQSELERIENKTSPSDREVSLMDWARHNENLNDMRESIRKDMSFGLQGELDMAREQLARNQERYKNVQERALEQSKAHDERSDRGTLKDWIKTVKERDLDKNQEDIGNGKRTEVIRDDKDAKDEQSNDEISNDER